MQTITNIDLRLLNWIHEHLACSFLDFLMPKITFLGNGGLIWIAAAIIMIFFKKYRKIGIMIGTGLSAGVIIGNILLKNLIARERPCWINETVQMLISTVDLYILHLDFLTDCLLLCLHLPEFQAGVHIV